MAMTEVQDRLRHLQLLTAVLVALGFAAIGSFAGFSVYANAKLNRSLDQQEQVIDSLCDSLIRAGIIFTGSEENPCER